MLRLDPDIFDAPVIVTNHDYRFLVQEQMAADRRRGPDRARAGAARFRRRRRGRLRTRRRARAARRWSRFSPPTMSCARSRLSRICARKAADAAAQGYIVTLGIKPTDPATGYGYIRPGESSPPRRASPRSTPSSKSPTSRPPKSYIEQGYLWNSGNFFFRADVMRAEFDRFEPEIAAAAAAGLRQGQDRSRLPGARRRRLRPRAEKLDRLCGDGAHLARGGDSRPISAGRTSAAGTRCGSFRTGTTRATPCAATAWCRTATMCTSALDDTG